MEDCKWRIVEGYTVQIYDETLDDDVVFAFTATSDFTQLTLTMSGDVYIRQ